MRLFRAVGAGFEARYRAGGYALRDLASAFRRLSDTLVCSRRNFLCDMRWHRATDGSYRPRDLPGSSFDDPAALLALAVPRASTNGVEHPVVPPVQLPLDP